MSYNSKFEEVFKKVSIDSYADFSKEMKLQWNRLKNQHYDMEKSCQFYDCKDLVRENLKNRFSFVNRSASARSIHCINACLLSGRCLHDSRLSCERKAKLFFRSITSSVPFRERDVLFLQGSSSVLRDRPQ